MFGREQVTTIRMTELNDSVVPELKNETVPKVENREGWEIGLFGPYWIGHYTAFYVSKDGCCGPQLWPLLVVPALENAHFAMIRWACEMEKELVESQPSLMRRERETRAEWLPFYQRYVTRHLMAFLNYGEQRPGLGLIDYWKMIGLRMRLVSML